MVYVPFVVQLITQAIRARQTASAKPIPVTKLTARHYIEPHIVKQQGDASISDLNTCLPAFDTIYRGPKPKQIP